ncbi:MAG: O-methyltransferase family 3 [Burkholderiales bacterium]|jgi:predicted O-methyltransferase YrrM|nr:O-methyltransferase family 3 [Burkholderiales bacterium]
MKDSITRELYQYARLISKAEHKVLQALRERTATVEGSHMQITPEQGQFMALMAKILNVRKYLEVGVFTGYSALAVTLAMSADNSQTFALDIDPVTMAIAKEYWTKAQVEHKITPIMGDAVLSLAKLVSDGHNNTFDMAFIDAKKSDYIIYFKHCYSLLRPGGVVFIDNIFMNGDVLSDKPKESAAAINKFNLFLQNLNVDYCVTTIADGLTIVRKT